jgi:molecular chaperone DnaK
MDGSEPRIIPNNRGNNLTPSVVSFTQSGDILVGEAAKNQAVINRKRTILSVKRAMGSDRKFRMDHRDFSPVDISSYILKKLKRDAEVFLGMEVHGAVISVPAYFNERQRRATKEAGRLAGFEVKRLINEPTATALAYGLQSERNVLIYDLGGGTFDITVLAREGNALNVLSTRGNNNLGGMDFDNLLLQKVLKQFYDESGFAPSLVEGKDLMFLQMLKEETEKAKIELSSRECATIAIPFVQSGDQLKHISCQLRRRDFEALISDLVDQTLELTMRAIKDAGLTIRSIDTYILSGGSSRIPLIKNRLASLLGAEKGLAADSLPAGGQKRQVRIRSNPDESVAMGAALQSALINGESKTIILKDVTPLALGVEVDGGSFIPLIKRNSPVPVSAKKNFTTIADNQRSVEVHILQGNSPKAIRNHSLGSFLLSGIREVGKGKPRIEVSFNMDVDGILQVTAHDPDTGSEKSVVLAQGNEQDYDQQGNPFSTITGLKKRINFLIRRISCLTGLAGDRIFAVEIKEITNRANQALISGSSVELSECRIALERILGDLEIISKYLETESEGA